MPAPGENTKTRVIAALEGAWRDFRRALEPLSASDMGVPDVCGPWSVKDLLGHVAAWEAHAVKTLLTGAPEPIADVDGFNHAEAQRRADLALRDVLVELESTHRALRSALADAPEGRLEPGSPVRDSLDADTVFHYLEHTAQIRAWSARRRKPKPERQSRS